MTEESPFGSPSKKRVRMRDVAARCGVSVSTVSLVLSGDPRIPEDTTRKVIQTVKAMEYRPNVIARNLARKGSRVIGVILPEQAFSQNPTFYYQALRGIHEETQAAGYKMIVEAANRGFLERRYYHRLLKEQSADGIIYMAATTSDIFLGDMSRETAPFVLLACSVEEVDLPTVKGWDFEGGKKIAEYFISLGHKKIGHIAGPQSLGLYKERRQGFLDALLDGGISPQADWIIPGDFEQSKIEQAVTLITNYGLTAVFCAGDSMAYPLMAGLRQAGLKVPEDVSVAGMDDLEPDLWVFPPLTTVRYDIAKMAKRAARYVLKNVQIPVSRRVGVGDPETCELIIRSSCAPRPS